MPPHVATHNLAVPPAVHKACSAPLLRDNLRVVESEGKERVLARPICAPSTKAESIDSKST
jgi:hypothetical protein